MKFNPELDLQFERKVPCPSSHLWKGWTDPELLKKWFCPLPWKVTECEIQLSPGGKFFTVMQGPQGERHDNIGCYLEIIPGKKLVWTSALLPDFRPAPIPSEGFTFTAMVEFEPCTEGSLYRAHVFHRTPADREIHEKMGFKEGWGIALDQLVALYTP